MRGIQVLIALIALFAAPIVGLVAPIFAVFAGASGFAGLSAVSWHKSFVATIVFTTLQIAALAGTVWISMQPATSDMMPTAPSAANQPGGAGSIPSSDRAAP